MVTKNPLDLIAKGLQDSTKVMEAALISAKRRKAFFFQQKAKSWVKSGGEGKWPKRSEVGRLFRQKKDGTWRRARKRERGENALGKFVGLIRYTKPASKKATFDVGFSSKRSPRRILPGFDELSIDLQRPRSKLVSEEVQKAMARSKNAIAKSKRKKAIPGKDYFGVPIGEVLVNPERDIFDSVQKKYERQANVEFEKEFVDRFNFEIRKRNLPFTQLK